MDSARYPFVKGHGTENDFVLLPDPDGTLDLDPVLVRAICDRRAGIGADGVIRVVPTAAVPGHQDVAGSAPWFMDYRNADGSLAQMCGNGARVFARFLVDAGWQQPGRFAFLTRAGIRTADLAADGDVSVEMGPVRIVGVSTAELAGRTFTGTVADVGNPHLVCRVAPGLRLEGLDLSAAPGHDPIVFPDGVNVEFVDDSAGEVRMRVFERGVGETRSCGTGTVAVAAEQLHRAGRTSGRVLVRVPGGAVTVTLEAAVGSDGGTPEAGFGGAVLTGPAVLVASGELRPAALRSPADTGAAAGSRA
ncbi:diaminopimelate epimerase [Nakamurella endophytica]|uniref:Diaminopimelate epimerase n=1 Tax=Nakamurella endophytica TaxID=1748367 RepID=A0A917T7A8_9ACTN|nr:diaminopimelate epimerase [Nakamurella endophytica]GGM13055.1 diaminopimelate epimerase [Nakamurella endophytica]